MKQEIHPAWKVCAGLGILLFVTLAYAGRVLLTQQRGIDANQQNIEDIERLLNEVQAQQIRGEERAYIARALSGCADIINDSEMEITSECTDQRVAAYYPPKICQLLGNPENCGVKAEVVLDPTR